MDRKTASSFRRRRAELADLLLAGCTWSALVAFQAVRAIGRPAR